MKPQEIKSLQWDKGSLPRVAAKRKKKQTYLHAVAMGATRSVRAGPVTRRAAHTDFVAVALAVTRSVRVGPVARGAVDIGFATCRGR